MTSNPAVAAILAQAHRELAAIPDIEARIRVYAEMVDELVNAGRFLHDERARKLAEVAQMRADANELRQEERRIAKGWTR